MGPDEMHPWVLRELADVVAKPSSNILEKLWQPEVSTDCKRGNIIPIFTREEKRNWQDCGADPAGSYAKAHGQLLTRSF